MLVDSNTPAFIINLDTRKDRWDKISEMARKANICVQKIQACNGRQLSIKDRFNSAELLCALFCSPGGIGCHVSHVKAWKAVVDSGKPYAIIFEDDSVVPEDFWIKLHNQPMHDDWSVVYLSGGCPGAPCIPYLRKEKTSIPNVWSVGPHANNGCYIIKKEAAQYLLDNHSKAKSHVDVTMTDLLNKNGYKIYSIEPSIVPQSDLYTGSDIGNREENGRRSLIANVVHPLTSNKRYDITEYGCNVSDVGIGMRMKSFSILGIVDVDNSQLFILPLLGIIIGLCVRDITSLSLYAIFMVLLLSCLDIMIDKDDAIPNFPELVKDLTIIIIVSLVTFFLKKLSKMN